MTLRHLLSRHTVKSVSRLNGRVLCASPYVTSHAPAITSTISPSFLRTPIQSLRYAEAVTSFNRYIHSSMPTSLSESNAEAVVDSEEVEDDGTMNEFLSRFVWLMRGKLSEVYQDCDKKTMDAMLLIIVDKVVEEMEQQEKVQGIKQPLGSSATSRSDEFSDDLWSTVWEVCNKVLDDMEKAKKKEKMKAFLQDEEVKEMCRFAGEVGIRGEMLRELRFKWAREKMEDSEFYQSLEILREDEDHARNLEDGTVVSESETESEEAVGSDSPLGEDEPKVASLPKRHGKIKYKIYGLDLSDSKWADVADKIHEAEKFIWPQEAKPISGRNRVITDKILSLQEKEDPSPLLAEWIQLLQPSRTDWNALLDGLREKNSRLYFKVAELVLGEESFETSVRDYSKLIESHAKENRFEDAERILKKMTEKGIMPDTLLYTVLAHMYSKAGNIEQAKEAFTNLKNQGFRPDMKMYHSMFMSYVNVGEAKSCEDIMREMERQYMKPTEEMYIALLRLYARRGNPTGAQKIDSAMRHADFKPTAESCALLVEAYGQSGDVDQARSNFDYMIRVGHKPDDRCVAIMVAAYEKTNLLDRALNLLLELEKGGFEPGVATYSALVDWLCRLQLVNEAEHLLGKIAELGESPPINVHVGLCEMYAKAGVEKKALQALGVLEAKKEELGQMEFERIIDGLVKGGFAQDAQRIHGLLVSRGFEPTEKLKMSLMTSQGMAQRKNEMAPKRWEFERNKQ